MGSYTEHSEKLPVGWIAWALKLLPAKGTGCSESIAWANDNYLSRSEAELQKSGFYVCVFSEHKWLFIEIIYGAVPWCNNIKDTCYQSLQQGES